MNTKKFLLCLSCLLWITACSQHTPPTAQDIQKALKIQYDVQVDKCRRHNSMDDDPRGDWYGCQFTVFGTNASGKAAHITMYSTFMRGGSTDFYATAPEVVDPKGDATTDTPEADSDNSGHYVQ